MLPHRRDRSVDVRPRLLFVLNDHQHDIWLNFDANSDFLRVYSTSHVMAIFINGMMRPRRCLNGFVAWLVGPLPCCGILVQAGLL